MEPKSQVVTIPQDYTTEQEQELFFKATQTLEKLLRQTTIVFPDVIAIPSPRLSTIHIWVENAHIVISQNGVAYIKQEAGS